MQGLSYISGTADDPINPPASLATGLSVVQVQMKRTGDTKYWNGGAWDTSQAWVDATGTTSWSYVGYTLNTEILM